jgi:hypothetical protein
MDIDERPFKRESGSDKRPGFPIKSTRYSLAMETKQSQDNQLDIFLFHT